MTLIAKKTPVVSELTEDVIRYLGSGKISTGETIDIEGVPSLSGRSERRFILIQGALISQNNKDIETADILNWSDKLKLLLTELNAKKVTVAAPKMSNITRIRKVLECSFCNTGVEIQIMADPEDNASEKEQANKTVIEGLGDSFASVVRALRTKIDPTKCGVRIKSVSKNENASATFSVVELKEGGKDEWNRRIREKIPENVKVRQFDHKTAIVIKNIGGDVEKHKLIQEIAAVCKMDEDQIRLNDFRRGFRGSSMITAFLDKKHADVLLSQKHINIGWYRCKVSERIDPPFCQNCQKIGHNRQTYCNLNCSTRAHCIMERNAEEMNADIIACSEPNINEVKTSNTWTCDNEWKVAIKSPGHFKEGRGPGFVWIDNGKWVFFVCYISPNV